MLNLEASSPLRSLEPPKVADRLVATTDGGDALDALVARHFGFSGLYGWQREAIEALLGGSGRVLLVAPTGGGKSLCYQLPALALPGTALILSPLISLMEDQVRALEARGIAATFLASSLPREENARRLAGVRRGAYRIVYAAPERLAFDGFLDTMEACRLSLVAVDEAHCIVQWGHDFRPDYLRIGEAIRRLRPARTLACTATATPEARDEIVRRLGWADRAPTVILRGFARPNLHLAVREVSGPKDAQIATVRALADALGSPKNPVGAGIVYAATRKITERLAEELREAGWDAAAYHAGLDPEVRSEVSARFAARKIPVVVATNAFGMGIDRPDVRLVVHAQPPSSIEAYYQEVGRAGRDGQPADGLLLIAGADIALRRRMAELGGDGNPASEAETARAWGLFRELLRYVDAASCRHDFILRYFGDEAESLGGCGHCDVCLAVDRAESEDPAALERDLDIIRRALAGVARVKGGAGMQAVASMLAGEHNERVDRLGLDRLSTFGVLPGKSSDEALRILRVLLANDWIDLTSNEYPCPIMTAPGWRVMKGEQAVRVRLPPPRAPKSRRRERTSSRTDAASPRGERGEKGEKGKPQRMTVEEAVRAGMCEAVYEALRARRTELAREADVPAYVIAPDRTLMELSMVLPRSLHEVAAVHGMGPMKLAAFGETLLEVIHAARPDAAPPR
jgi:ATP-dependent DNA helicase RecQ